MIARVLPAHGLSAGEHDADTRLAAILASTAGQLVLQVRQELADPPVQNRASAGDTSRVQDRPA